MSLRAETVTKVSLRGCPEYLPRLRTIAACLAENAGVDSLRAEEATELLTTACFDSVRRGSPASDAPLSITFQPMQSGVAVDVTGLDGAVDLVDNADCRASLRARLLWALACSTRFITDRTGVTVGFIIRARNLRRAHRGMHDLATLAYRG